MIKTPSHATFEHFLGASRVLRTVPLHSEYTDELRRIRIAGRNLCCPTAAKREREREREHKTRATELLFPAERGNERERESLELITAQISAFGPGAALRTKQDLEGREVRQHRSPERNSIAPCETPPQSYLQGILNFLHASLGHRRKIDNAASAQEWSELFQKCFALLFMAVVDFDTSDFETCPKYQNWANWATEP